MESLKDKVVIITGSSSGIRAATAELFSKYGSKLVITGRNAEKLSHVALRCEEVSPNKYQPITVLGEITDEGTRGALVSKCIEKFGKLDVLVNNAGGCEIAEITAVEFPASYDRVMNVNLRSPLMLTRLAIPHLMATKGCVINVSSITSFGIAFPNTLPYHISKSGMDSMTRILAHELGPNGVRVISINAGFVKTSIFERMNLPKKVYDDLAKDLPLRRSANSEEVASVICFLASSGASFITGSSVLVNGGHRTS